MPEERASKMPGGWWIPVVAAVVGLVGGVGGAYVGGSVANEGQEEQFENQRTAQIQDLVIETYASYLRTTAGTWVAIQADSPDAEKRVSETLAALGVVEFETTDAPEVGDVANQLLRAATKPADESEFRAAQLRFIEVAANSLGE